MRCALCREVTGQGIPSVEKQIRQRHEAICDYKELMFWCLKQKHSQLLWSDKQARRKKDARSERICGNRQSTALKRHCGMVTQFPQDKLYGQKEHFPWVKDTSLACISSSK